jgi:hypothetical protein
MTSILLAGTAGLSQEPTSSTAVGLENSTRAGSSEQLLDKSQNLRREGNVEGVASQKRVEELSDKTDKLFARYSSTLRQVDSIKVYNKQMDELVASQRQEMDSITSQLDKVEEVGRSVTPLMLRMIDSLAAFIKLDVPFLIDERNQRIARLVEMMTRADVTSAEKFRSIMEAYQIENEFGRTIEAYRSTLPSDGKVLTVDYLRFGRIALIYQTIDESEAGVWDQKALNWRSLDSSYRTSIRKGLRIARKQAAPDMILLPLPAAQKAGDAS